MPHYVLTNRRSGLYAETAKVASRASVATTLSMLTNATVLADHKPKDQLARQVALLDADADQVASLRAELPADLILEPAIHRKLHLRTPIELRPSVPHTATAAMTASAGKYTVRITAGGKPLAGIDVMLYLRDPGGGVQSTTVQTDSKGKLTHPVPAGFQVAFVEPIPYAGYWIMLAGAPGIGKHD